MPSSVARSRGLVGVEPEQVALTSSTTEGCAIVLRGLGLEPGDEIVTTTDEHFGLLGPLGASPARVVVVEPDPDRILAAVTPADEADRDLAGALDDGRCPAARRAARAERRPGARGRRAVGRGDPDERRAASTSSRSRARSGSAAPTRRGARRARPRRPRVDVAELLRADAGTSPTGRSRRTRGRAAVRVGLVVAGHCSAACSRRSSSGPTGGSSGRRPRRRGVVSCSPPVPRSSRREPCATLVSFRPEATPDALVGASAGARRRRPRDPGSAARARLVRLVDERRRPRPPGRRARRLSPAMAAPRNCVPGTQPRPIADRSPGAEFSERSERFGALRGRMPRRARRRAVRRPKRRRTRAAARNARARLEPSSCAETAPSPVGRVAADADPNGVQHDVPETARAGAVRSRRSLDAKRASNRCPTCP